MPEILSHVEVRKLSIPIPAVVDHWLQAVQRDSDYPAQWFSVREGLWLKQHQYLRASLSIKLQSVNPKKQSHGSRRIGTEPVKEI